MTVKDLKWKQSDVEDAVKVCRAVAAYVNGHVWICKGAEVDERSHIIYVTGLSDDEYAEVLANTAVQEQPDDYPYTGVALLDWPAAIPNGLIELKEV